MNAERKPDAWKKVKSDGGVSLSFGKPRENFGDRLKPLYAETNPAIEALVEAVKLLLKYDGDDQDDSVTLMLDYDNAVHAAHDALALWQPAAPDDSEARK